MTNYNQNKTYIRKCRYNSEYDVMRRQGHSNFFCKIIGYNKILVLRRCSILTIIRHIKSFVVIVDIFSIYYSIHMVLKMADLKERKRKQHFYLSTRTVSQLLCITQCSDKTTKTYSKPAVHFDWMMDYKYKTKNICTTLQLFYSHLLYYTYNL